MTVRCWGSIALVFAASACSSDIIMTPQDAGTGDGKQAQNDAGFDGGPGDFASSLVFVNGLVNGSATDQNGAPIVLDDVRVCVVTGTKSYALPDSAPMPLTNYAGVQRGRGADLGKVSPGNVVLQIYRASELAADAAWVADRSSFTCQTIGCVGLGLPCIRHVTVSASLVPGVNVVALVDALVDAQSSVSLEATSFTDTGFGGSPGELWGTFVDFSGWQSGFEIGAYYGNYVDGAGTNTTLVDPLVKPPITPKLVATLTTYDDLGVRFDAWSGGHAFARFGQSLDSIAFVSNATVTPPAFYDVRKNFVFALVGDPNDPTSVQLDGGRNPQFDGRGLHVVAIPYATPQP
jgi:hypothetical protein